MTKEDLETNLDRIHIWINASDQKVSIFLSFQGLVITLLFKDIYSWVISSYSTFSNPTWMAFISGGVFVLFSFYKSLLALIPKLEITKTSKSNIYFYTISKTSLSKYKKIVRDMSNDEYIDELSEQVYSCSKISACKYMHFFDSMLFFVIGVILFVISYSFFITTI